MIKIAPETAIKLSCNDRIKRYIAPDLDEITPLQRMVSGALAGCVAQVGLCLYSGCALCMRRHAPSSCVHICLSSSGFVQFNC